MRTMPRLPRRSGRRLAWLAITIGLCAGKPSAASPVLPLGGATLPPSPETRAEAVTCLADAISYEAGNEPEEGQEAVAQVVLNRLRDPAFPKTVCDVVFQGSSRRSGCQFTFTCDGSMDRRQPGRSWANALRIAGLAIDGRLVSPVGDATHYHAYYVNPAWAARLVRVARIGAHIFYGGGRSAAVAVPFRAVDTDRGATRRGAAAVFSVWGLRTAVLVPRAGAVGVSVADEPRAAIIPPIAPGTGGPPSR